MFKKVLIDFLIPILIVIVLSIVVIVFLILFMAGGESSSGGSSSFDVFYGSNTKEKVWFALLDAGYSKIAAAGVLGNIEKESGFDTTSTGPDGNAWGLCQWKDDRKDNLVAYAEEQGKDWTDEEIQIQYLLGELQEGGNTETKSTYQLSGSNGYVRSDWEKATTVEEAAKAFEGLFERSGGDDIEKRVNYAQATYNELKDKKKPSISNGKGYWWPVGGNSIIKENGVEYAPGTPTSTDIWWNPGWRTWGGGQEWHKGTDIGNSGGTDYIISIGNGTVVRRTNRIDWGNGYNNDGAGLDGYGNSCMVKYANDLYVIYGHMKANTVRVKNGDTVKRGQVLGVMGDSGSASGVHVCFVMLKGEAINQANTITDITKYVSTTNPRP